MSSSPIKKSVLDPGRLLQLVTSTSLPEDIANLKPDEVILQGYLKRSVSRDGTARGLPQQSDITSDSSSLYSGASSEGKRRWFVLTKTSLSWRKSQDSSPASSSSNSSRSSCNSSSTPSMVSASSFASKTGTKSSISRSGLALKSGSSLCQ